MKTTYIINYSRCFTRRAEVFSKKHHAITFMNVMGGVLTERND